MSVKSTYNFVPAPKESEVFKPDWGHQVSHDIPFKDGESGEITLKITAKTPIFIRNGHTKDVTENEFSHRILPNGDKEYFIPASSLKGMIRNVLEIMSYSRLKAQNDLFGFRDMANKKYKREVATSRSIKAGWLVKNNDQWEIQECSWGKMAIRDIETKFSTDEINISFRNKSAQEKYNLVQNRNHKFQRAGDVNVQINNRDVSLGKRYKFANHGEFNGSLVFFGEINRKQHEYVFSNNTTAPAFSISSDLMSRFKEIESKLSSSLWQFFVDNNYSRIPVFFVASETRKVKHFGFSKLYRMTNTKYLNELEPLKSYKKRNGPYRMDLSEVMFGTVTDNPKQTLKGRIIVANARVKEIGEGGIKPIAVLLSSPKPSYYPFYLKDGLTYLEEAVLNGFKKYPVHIEQKDSLLNPDNIKSQSTIKPLPNKTTFECKIRFHNLRKVEIGALLSAVTLHNQEDYFHAIGGGKPLVRYS